MAMFKDVIELITLTYVQDALGQEIEAKSKKLVFANKRSVSQTEFFNAGQSNLKAQYVFDIRLSEYKNERQLLHNDVTYSIYRVFEKGENIELYCEVRTGGK